MEFIRREILLLLFFYLRVFAWKYLCVLASSVLASACILHIVTVESVCFL